jgi:threonine aldolase
MYLASDNIGPALPEVMDALVAANTGHAAPYGADEVTTRATTALRDLFDAPQAAVHLVATGTAANCLALATLSQPWQAITCTPLAHILEDECHAPEFFTGGARLNPVGQAGDKMTVLELDAALSALPQGVVHGSQRGPVALTSVTERGQVYTLDELGALCDVAKAHGLAVHLDGARFANAVAALRCSPAQMTHELGIDALSFGATKNGCLGVEAVIFFDPAKAWELDLRRKRAGHLFSKHRYLAAQMEAYVTGDLWLDAARRANAKAASLVAGLREVPGFTLVAEPQANMIFATLPRATHKRLFAAGAYYYIWEGDLEGDDPDEPLLMRLVCDWSIPEADLDRFIATAKG